ncbi:MAG: 3-dehydroquinate synthase [Dysgonamonadaceae bacterium]|jgi:3-dehydroquinate synthase|nr:3-dehydroquinate synthase [Dysgonamonadaceae bacterium]
MKQQIIRSSQIEKDLAQILAQLKYDGLFLLTDENTQKFCFPQIEKITEIQSAKKYCIASGDSHKNVRTLAAVWSFLSENGANRKSLLINLGGGMLTDLGGFAAATFKRGIRFINIPTTLLGAVDAAVGGKTGINFNGLKNETGAFAPAIAVLINARFFQTLDAPNLLSGYAEMLKHALLDSQQALTELLLFDLENPDYPKLNDLLFESVQVKQRIVEEDPTEQGIRKALNLGHTFGHAFESLSYELNRPVLHGYAVAWGIVCELYLSFVKWGFDREILMKIAHFIRENYESFPFGCKHYARLYERMQHDKKNESGSINFTLLKAPGEIEINQTASRKEIEETLDFYCDFFH